MSDSDSDLEMVTLPTVTPPPKRRRVLLDPSALTSAPVYSNKVKDCLHLKPPAPDHSPCDHTEAALCDSPCSSGMGCITITDSEEEEEEEEEEWSKTPDQSKKTVLCCSPSPPPSPPPSYWSPGVQVSTPAQRRIDELLRKVTAKDDADDVIAPAPTARSTGAPAGVEGRPLVGRVIPLKFRCRTDHHRVSIGSSAPLSQAVEVLSVRLKVPPSCILLLRNEVELPPHSTANELGLGVTDIIDCVVSQDAQQETQAGNPGNPDIITVRLQGVEKVSAQEYSVHKEAPLGPVLSQYRASWHAGAGKVRFLFDGATLRASQTPAQLDMEDGDVIDVWGPRRRTGTSSRGGAETEDGDVIEGRG